MLISAIQQSESAVVVVVVIVQWLSHVQLFATLWTVAHGIFQGRVLEWGRGQTMRSTACERHHN